MVRHVIIRKQGDNGCGYKYVWAESLSELYRKIRKTFKRDYARDVKQLTEGMTFYLTYDEKQAEVITRAYRKTKPTDAEVILMQLVSPQFVSNAKMRNQFR